MYHDTQTLIASEDFPNGGSPNVFKETPGNFEHAFHGTPKANNVAASSVSLQLPEAQQVQTTEYRIQGAHPHNLAASVAPSDCVPASLQMKARGTPEIIHLALHR